MINSISWFTIDLKYCLIVKILIGDLELDIISVVSLSINSILYLLLFLKLIANDDLLSNQSLLIIDNEFQFYYICKYLKLHVFMTETLNTIPTIIEEHWGEYVD